MWLGVTIVLGIVFLSLQLYDYSQLGFGVKDGSFGTLFYVMTGLHMAHVFGGVVFLALVFGQAASGLLSRSGHESLEAGVDLLAFRRRGLDLSLHGVLPPHTQVIG